MAPAKIVIMSSYHEFKRAPIRTILALGESTPPQDFPVGRSPAGGPGLGLLALVNVLPSGSSRCSG